MILWDLGRCIVFAAGVGVSGRKEGSVWWVTGAYLDGGMKDY